MKRHRFVVPVLCGLLALLAACGDGASKSDEPPAAPSDRELRNRIAQLHTRLASLEQAVVDLEGSDSPVSISDLTKQILEIRVRLRILESGVTSSECGPQPPDPDDPDAAPLVVPCDPELPAGGFVPREP